MSDDEMYTIQEVADLIGLDYHTVWRARNSGKLKGTWDARHHCWKISKAQIKSWRASLWKRPKGEDSSEY